MARDTPSPGVTATRPAHYATVVRDGVLWTAVSGALDRPFSEAMIRSVAAQNPDALPFLMDFRGASADGLTSADVHALAGVLADALRGYRGRVALLDVYRPGFERLQFFEASATFRGVAARSFLDEAKAGAWAGSERPGPGSRPSLPDTDAL